MSKDVAIGAGRTLASEAIGRGAAIGFQMLLANQLGASRFGIVSLALAAAATLSPLADAGLPNLALQLVSGSPKDDRLVSQLLGLKVALTPFFLLPLLAWAFLFPLKGEESMPLLWAGAFYGFQASSDLLRQVLRAREAIKQELLARLFFPLANVVALFSIWLWKPGPSGALLALASGPFVLTFAYLAVFPKTILKLDLRGSTKGFALQHWPSLTQSFAYLLLAGIATRIDAFILEAYAGTAHVGRFFATSNLVLAGMFFGQGLSSYLYPRLHRQTTDRSRALLRAAALQAGLGAVLCTGAVLVGPIAFRLVFRSGSFAGSERMISGFAIILFLATMDSLWVSILIGRRKLWIAALNLIPAILVKLVLGRLWVPEYAEIGMLWTSVAAYVCSVSLNACFAVRHYLHTHTERDPIHAR
jgi:O-antigen/teichoic acid export membrane protein